jgi:hypothetical protein
MDADLDQMTRDELIAEVNKLRAGIRTHRDSSEHELCWDYRRFRVCYLKGPILCRSCRNGRSSFEDVSDNGSRWTHKSLPLHERTNHMKKRNRWGTHARG